jgi:hypothetical protein
LASTNYSSPQFLSKDDLIDERTFNFGEIWKIRDCLISIPDADRINSRNEHYYVIKFKGGHSEKIPTPTIDKEPI